MPVTGWGSPGDTLIVKGKIHSTGNKNTSDYLLNILAITHGDVIFPEYQSVLEIDSVISGSIHVPFKVSGYPVYLSVSLLNSACLIDTRDKTFTNKKGVWKIVQWPGYMNVVQNIESTPFKDNLRNKATNYNTKIAGWINILQSGQPDSIAHIIKALQTGTYCNPSRYQRTIDFRTMPYIIDLFKSSETFLDTSTLYIDYINAPAESIETVMSTPVSELACRYIYGWFDDINKYELGLGQQRSKMNYDSISKWWGQLVSSEIKNVQDFYAQAEVLHLSDYCHKYPGIIPSWENHDSWSENWGAILYPSIYQETFNEPTSESRYFRIGQSSMVRFNDYRKISFFRYQDTSFVYDTILEIPRERLSHAILNIAPLDNSDWLATWFKNKSIYAQTIKNRSWYGKPKRIVKFEDPSDIQRFIPVIQPIGDKIFIAFLNKYDVYIHIYDKDLEFIDSIKVSQTSEAYCCGNPMYLNILTGDSTFLVYWGKDKNMNYRVFNNQGIPITNEKLLANTIFNFGNGLTSNNNFLIVYTENTLSHCLFRVAVINPGGTQLKTFNAGMHDKGVHFNLTSKIVDDELLILYRNYIERSLTYKLAIPVDELIIK